MLAIVVTGIVAMLLAMHLKGMKSEYGVIISLAACILMLTFGVDRLSVILDAVNRIQDFLAIPSAYISLFVKMLGITYLCEFSANLCEY